MGLIKWLRNKWKGKQDMAQQQTGSLPTLDERLVALERFWFLADTPLFVDSVLVNRLYDAVFRPEVELASQSDATTNEVAAKVAGGAKASAEIQAKVPPLLSLFGLDVANAKAGLEGSVSGEGSGRRANTGTTSYAAVKSTERRLEKVVSLYAQKYSRRLFWIGSDLTAGRSLHEPNRSQSWEEMESELGRPGPRPLVVLDVDKGARLMPMFGELTNGKGCDLLNDFLALREKRKDDAERPPYPRSSMPAEEQAKVRRAYWQHVLERFDSQGVLQSIEGAAGAEKSRFDWIDFRALLDLERANLNEPPHLHLIPRGEYSTGTFAYQLVRRGSRYGLRILGTLKRGQDINVLAIYER
jgi:hypothetical protein